jgi:hypothetical protein
VDQLVLAPKWRPLNGVDPSCCILKPRDSNILHDKSFEKVEQKQLIKKLENCKSHFFETPIFFKDD